MLLKLSTTPFTPDIFLFRTYFFNYFLLILYFLSPSALSGQTCLNNIVPNPGFENILYCPFGLNQMDAVANWEKPFTGSASTGTSDYYNTCGFNTIQPNTGNGYAGFYTYINFIPNAREYVQVQLSSPLEAGKCYEASMYLALDAGSGYGNDSIGLYFSNTAPDSPGGNLISATPQVASTIAITDTNWVQVTGSFVALGGEEFLTIGVFTTDPNLTITPTGSGGIATKYMVDDVCVRLGSSAGNDTSIMICDNMQPFDLLEFMGGAPENGGVFNPLLSSGDTLFNPALDAAGVYTYVHNDVCANSSIINIALQNCVLCGSNLIPNPSFEDITYCPNNLNQMDAVGNWEKPVTGASGTGTSDYYNTCGFNSIQPNTGNGHSGFYTYINFIPNAREYVQVELPVPLGSGKCYEASMHLALGVGSGYGNDSIGMYFSNSAPPSPGGTMITATPQIASTVVVTDTNWVQVTGTFVAAGGEKFLTIGVFTADPNLTITPTGAPGIAAKYMLDDVCLFEGCTILPVELVGFDATREQDDVHLTWATATEVNTDEFIIQRATNDSNFKDIASVEAAGQSQVLLNYNYLDEKPPIGYNYYRLKQVDIDGLYEFSEIRAVEIDNTSIDLFPNPSADMVQIVSSNDDVILNVVVYDEIGRIVKQFEIDQVSEKLELDIIALAKGCYYFKVFTDKGKSVLIRFFKN